MKMLIKNERGVSLISLAVAIIILGIIVSMLVYNVKDTKEIEKLTNMYTDIDNIGDRISNYYSRYGALPILKDVDLSSNTTINKWISEKGTDNSPLGANDTNIFYVIDLKALENLTLNYGKDFEKISENVIPNDNDIYVINENSHNIFYLKGVKINNNGSVKTYYTNLEKDKEKVDLRYFDGIKIPDGFKYESGKNKDDLIIKNDTTNTQYNWANIEDGIYTLNEQNVSVVDNNNQSKGLVFDSTQNISDLKESIKEFGGFYFNASGNVYYFSVAEDDNWGKAYDTTQIYIDKNGDKAYIPVGFKISKLSSLNTINKGLVIKNQTTNDEYVWIDVPDDVLAKTKTLEEVENALKEYAKDYRQDGYEDIWYDGCGISSKNEYNNLKNKMLQSIKENGGFYIGRYEAGTNRARTSGTSADNVDDIIGNEENPNLGYGKPLSQKDKYPYNFVTVRQAQGLAQSIKPQNVDYETSLMFGIQWDLTCKFLEETGAKTYDEIAKDSTSWGNFKDSDIIFNEENGQMFIWRDGGRWENINGYDKVSGNSIMYTTGATKRNMSLNIYDLAGNVYESILEQSTNNHTVICGGSVLYNGNVRTMNNHQEIRVGDYYRDTGFRVALFK